MTSDELRGELRRAISVTSEHLGYMARIWAELEQRGEDLTEFKSGVGYYLSQIASGKILPELVANYFGSPGTVRRLVSLSAKDQKKVCDSGKFPWKACEKKSGSTPKSVDDLPRLNGAAVNGSPRDVAFMILAMIENNSDPLLIVEILLSEFNRKKWTE